MIGAIVAGFLLVVLATRFGDLLNQMRSMADFASPLVMAEQLHGYTDAQAMTGHYGWWPGLWFLQAIRPLPGNSYLGAYAPGLVSLAFTGLLAWEARRLWGTLGGVVVVLVGLSVSAAAWAFLMAWSGRAPTWWAMVLLAVVVVRVLANDDRWTPLQWWFAGIAVVGAALVLSGDSLAWLTTVVPMLAVAALLAWRRRWRAAGTALAIAIVVAGLSVALRRLADAAGYLRQSYALEIARYEDLGAGFNHTIEGLLRVWRGTGDDVLDVTAAYLGAILVFVAVIAGGTWLVRRLRPPAGGATGAPPVGAEVDAPGALSTEVRAAAPRASSREADTDTDTDVEGEASAAVLAGRELWMAYWGSALVVMLVAFMATTGSYIDGLPVERYLYGVPFAAAAVLAGLAQRGSGWWIAAPVIVLGVAAAVSSSRTTPPTDGSAHTKVTAAVVLAAKEHGVRRGYASYWSASPIQLASGGQLDMVAAGGCPGVEPYTLCPMYLHYIDKAYVPEAGRGSFLLIDRGGAKAPAARTWLTRLPAGLHPRAQIDVGEGITMAIFDEDVAAAIRPQAEVGAPGQPAVRPG